MIIDIFAHHISRKVGEKLARTPYYGEGKQFNYPPQNADAEVRIGLMDKYGIDIQALSQTTPVLLDFNAEEAAEICHISNDDNYSLCKAYPDRFVNICIFSLLDVKSAILHAAGNLALFIVPSSAFISTISFKAPVLQGRS